MNVYIRNAGPTISGLVAKAAEKAGRRMSLDDEVDLARAMVLRAVDYWNVALEAGDIATDSVKMQCERLVTDAVETVVRIVHQAAKVRLLDEGAVQLSSVDWVIGEVTKIIDNEVRAEAPTVADRIVEKIKMIELPMDGTLKQFMKSASDEAFL